MKNLRRRKDRTDSKPQARGGSNPRGRKSLSRLLWGEALEQRQMLAGDGDPTPHHNTWAARDVNNDLRVTPMDALVVLNDLNRNGSRDLSGEDVRPFKFVDVNSDNRISSLDALQVINALNRGSGEDVPIVEMILGLTDDDGNSLVNEGTRTADLGVGEIVNLEILFTDARLFGAGLGLFTVYTDILVDQTGFLEPLVTETQVLTLSENFVDSNGGFVTLTQEGGAIAQVPFSQIAANPAGAIRDSLINDFGYAPEQIFTTLETREPRDPANGRPEGDPFDIFIRYLGDDFIDVDVPNMDIDASGLLTSTGDPVVGSSDEIKPKLPDGSINPVAVGFSLDTRSRTGQGANVYTNVRSGSFNDDSGDSIPDGFSNIGATGQLNAGGLPAILGSTPYVPNVPFEAFSIRARVTQPIEGLNLSLNIPLEDAGNPNESVLVIYGNRPDGTSGDERGLSPAEYVLDADATLQINVSDVITARPDGITTDEDESGSVNVLSNDSTQGTGPLTLVSATNGANGATSISGGVVTYTPDPDYFGSDQFTYVVENGDGDRATGTVTVTVVSVNDPPTADDFPIIVTEGMDRILEESEFLDRSDAGPANENQTPMLVSVSDAASLGTAVLNNDGTVTYTAPVGYEGPDTFTYEISDGEDSVTATVSVTVVDQNDPPEANDDTVNGVEDTPVTFTEEEFFEAVLANDVPGPQNEIDAGQVVTLVSVDSVGSAGGTWLENQDGTYTYTPPANVFGSPAETFEYVITDGELEDTGTITVNLEAVNDAPMAADDDFIVDELTTANELNVLSNDSAGPFEDSTQSISVAGIVNLPSNGQATISGDGLSILYTPNNEFVGQDSFTYVISDGDLQSEPATVTIDVVPVIRPRARDDQFEVDEDSGLTSLPVTANDLANEGASVVLESVDSIPASQGTLAINGNNVDFTPAPDFFGQVVFSYTITDTSNPVIDDEDEIAAATGQVTVTVNPVNDPPVPAPDEPFSTLEDTPLEISGGDLVANDDPGAPNEDDTLSVSAVASQSQQGGTVSLAGQTITYTPAPDYNSNFSAEDTFTYTVSDGAGGTAEATVTVSVTPVNDAPQLDLENLSASEDMQAVFSQSELLGDSLPGPATATDESSQTLEVVSVGSNGQTSQGGTVSVSGGQVTYLSAANFFGTDTFAVTVRDSEGATSTATATITISNVNDPPVLGDPPLIAFSQSTATFTSSQLLEGSNVGPGESGLPGQILGIVNARAIAGTTGSIQFNSADGSVRYTAQTGFEGVDTFEITITDGSLTTTGLVTVDVQEFQPSTVNGAVFFDLVESIQNPVRNGIRDPHEPGLQMVQVRLVSDATQNVTGQMIHADLITDRNGDFEFTNVPPGQYRLIFDMPLMVHDGPDIAGTLGDSDSVMNQFTFEIDEPGGFSAEDYNFAVLGYAGRAGNAMDLLVSNYLRNNPDVASGSNNGLQGAKAYLDASGHGQWFVFKAGFDGVRFGEVNLDASASTVALSVVTDDGTVLTGLVPENRRVILKDGSNGYVVQLFGSLSDFNLQPDGSLNDGDLGLLHYQESVDRLLSQDGDVV